MTRFDRGRLTAVLAAGVLALGAAGCGGGDGEDAADTPTATPTQAGGGDGGGGGQAQERFASTCGGCHTLEAAGTGGTVGPSLDDIKPDKEQVLQAIAQGPGQMPEDLLEGAEAEAVADYVAKSAGG